MLDTLNWFCWIAYIIIFLHFIPFQIRFFLFIKYDKSADLCLSVVEVSFKPFMESLPVFFFLFSFLFHFILSLVFCIFQVPAHLKNFKFWVCSLFLHKFWVSSALLRIWLIFCIGVCTRSRSFCYFMLCHLYFFSTALNASVILSSSLANFSFAEICITVNNS